jgi:hypothetical protein
MRRLCFALTLVGWSLAVAGAAGFIVLRVNLDRQHYHPDSLLAANGVFLSGVVMVNVARWMKRREREG